MFICQGIFWGGFLRLLGEASSGKHVTNMDTVRNLEWATYTCTLSFNTFGRLIKLFKFIYFITLVFCNVCLKQA